MSIFDRFANQFGSQFNSSFDPGISGQSAIGQNSSNFGQRRPRTMQEWQTYVAGLSRYERDQLYPGMHKDLIPAAEMIDAMNKPVVLQTGFGLSQPASDPLDSNTPLTHQKTGFGLKRSPVSSPPGNVFGATPADMPSQTQVDLTPGQKLPQTTAEWTTLVDGMSRHERDQLWPGMHKDLIPATEMIDAGIAGRSSAIESQEYRDGHSTRRQDDGSSDNTPTRRDPGSFEDENPQCKYIRAEARELDRDVVRYREQSETIGRNIKKHENEIRTLSAAYDL